jgi:transcription-repair coupling factor (superfamily II helicase)
MNFDFLNLKLDFIDNFIKSKTLLHLVLTGFLSPCNLFLIEYLIKKNKKVLFVTPDEQSALKAQRDLETFLNIKSEVLISQEISPYSELEKNYYIYQEQLNIFMKQPEVLFVPVKSLLEKFAPKEFYENNSICFKKGETVDYSLISKKLVELGYKRTVNVTDIGEFALRGDILDVYALDYNPIRIEFFADTIEDIRYFNVNTQKSFKNIEKTTIYPIYCFCT